MDSFIPFIHKIEKKKKEEYEPLYIELYPPMEKIKEDEEKEESTVIIIDLL